MLAMDQDTAVPAARSAKEFVNQDGFADRQNA
jgi:hypothetical protein